MIKIVSASSEKQKRRTTAITDDSELGTGTLWLLSSGRCVLHPRNAQVPRSPQLLPSTLIADWRVV